MIENLLNEFCIPHVGSTHARLRHALETRKGLLLIAAELAYSPQMERAQKIEEELLKVEGRMTAVRNALTRAGIGETVQTDGAERWMTEAARVDMLAARERSATPIAPAAVPLDTDSAKWRYKYCEVMFGRQQAELLAEPHPNNCQGCSHPTHFLSQGDGLLPSIQRLNATLVERHLGMRREDAVLVETSMLSLIQQIWALPEEQWMSALLILAAIAVEHMKTLDEKNG